MLATFRNHAKGWAAWVLVIIISIPFAFWGISQYRSLVTTDYVAKVNGEKIMPNDFQRAYEQTYQQRQSALGGKFNPTQQEEQALKQQVLNDLINRALVREQAAKDKLVTNKTQVQAEIAQMPAFQSNGRFDFDRYRVVLADNNLTEAQFVNQIRDELTAQQLEGGVQASAVAVPKEVDSVIALLKEKRDVAWFVVPLDKYKPAQPPSDNEIEAYYKAHQQEFSTPTTLTVNYVRLDEKTLEGKVQVTPEDLQSYYDTHQNKFGIPPARKAAGILIKPDGTGTRAWSAAKAEAESLLAQLKGASDPEKTFSKLAEEKSADKVSSRNGGALGWIARGQMPQPFDKALFGIAKTGGIAGPVRVKQGWYLIQLLDERGGSVKPFDQVKEEVAKDYRESKAMDLYYKLGDQLANLAYEHPDSLEPVAQKLGLQVQSESGVSRNDGQGVAKNDKIRQAAFSDTVMKQHRNSEPVKLGTNDAVVLRVSDVQPSHPKPLADVKGAIVSALDRQEAEASARAATQQALKALRSGRSMTDVALSLGVAAQKAKAVERSGSNLPPGLATAVFSTPPLQGSPRYGSTKVNGDDVAVFAVEKVIPGDATSAKQEEVQGYMQALMQLYANQTEAAYTAWLRSQAEIKIDKDNIP